MLTDSCFYIPTMKPKGQKSQAEEVHTATEYAAPNADFECACNTCPSQEACKAAQEAAQTAPAEEKIDFKRKSTSVTWRSNRCSRIMWTSRPSLSPISVR